MIRNYRVVSALLSYPTEELRAAAGEMKQALEAEKLLAGRALDGIIRLVDDIAARDIYDLQERYVLLFDRTRSLSLHLFEHVHGESRDRGQVMIDLLHQYETHGLLMDSPELPDHLPLFLEFLATLSIEEARTQLTQPLHILSALRERLQKRKSVYAAAFVALEALADTRPAVEAVEAVLAEPDDDPEDLEALDRSWAEEPIMFGPGAGSDGCSRVDRMLSNMGVPGNSGRSR